MKKPNLVNVAIALALFLGGAIAGVAMSDIEGEVPVRSWLLRLISPAPVITSIEPKEAEVGTIITIRGKHFRQANNVGFRQVGSDKMYYTDVPLFEDGTLTFELPDVLGVCPGTQPLPKNAACIDIGIMMPTGEVEVVVINANGWSKPVLLTVNQDPRDPQLEAWDTQMKEYLNTLVNNKTCASVSSNLDRKNKIFSMTASSHGCAQAILAEAQRLGIPIGMLSVVVQEP